jgi:LDH2 family malate/lactate/ureidoglycolate dehydrogenase
LDRTGDDDANSVYLAVHDPEAFGGEDLVRRQASRVVELYQGLAPRTVNEAPRVPGQRALALKREALDSGLAMPPVVHAALVRCAQQWGVDLPR